MITEKIPYVHGGLYKARIDNIKTDPAQPRKFFCPEAHSDLVRSIADVGLMQPIVVTSSGGDYLQIVAGERRFRAALEAGLTQLDVRYVDRCTAEISIIENLLREDLLPIETAEALLRVKALHGYSHEELAGIIGKSVPTVSEILKLNRLTDDIKAECRDDKRYVHTRLLYIAKLKHPQAMRKHFDTYKAELTEPREKKEPVFVSQLDLSLIHI